MLTWISRRVVVCPHLEYSIPACSPNLVVDINHQERIQRLATRLVTGMRHLPYKERLQWLGLHSLQSQRLRDDLITAFKIFKGLLDIDPNLFFLPFKVLQGASRRRRKGWHFRWGLWNTGISSRLPPLQLLLSMFLRNGWRKFGQKSFPIFPIDWTLTHPPSHLHTTH